MNQKHGRYKVGKWISDELPSWWAWIYIGGDRKITEKVCREITFPSGLCVTVEKINYIFGGGTELGVRVGLIQYPPFPESEADLMEKAIELGKRIAEANYQWSYSIVTSNQVRTYSRRVKE